MEIRKLNTLRGIAALIVVVSHYSNTSNLLDGALGKGAGQFGVMLFFILSGFLMSYLYMGREFNRSEVYKYAVARAARVLPLFLIVVLSSYLLIKMGVTGVLYNIPSNESLISHFLLLSGTSVLWTIPAEIQFYLIFIVLWWFWRNQLGQLYIIISLIMVVLIFFDFPRIRGNISGISYDFALIRSLPYFLMGLIFGRLYINWKAPDYLTSRLFVLSLLLIPLLYPKIFHFITGHNHEMWRDVGILLCVSLVFFSIVFFVPDNYALIANRIGDFLGKISYSLYLLHIPILVQIKTYAIKSPELYLPIFLILSIVVSYISYLVVENPSRLAIRAIASNNRMHSDRKKHRSFLSRLFSAGDA